MRDEMSEFGDILEYDRIDSYETLPDKTFAGYQGGSKNMHEILCDTRAQKSCKIFISARFRT